LILLTAIKNFIDIGGDIGPFQLAILLTVISLVLILSWRENYGSAHNDNSKKAENDQLSYNGQMFQSMKDSLHVILQNPQILYLGLSQAIFEGAVFTFGKQNLN